MIPENNIGVFLPGTLVFVWVYGSNLKLENNTCNLIILTIISPSVITTYSPILTVKVLQGLWKNDLVALKGACPNCGEEVSLL
jgi:hypothetical protein